MCLQVNKVDEQGICVFDVDVDQVVVGVVQQNCMIFDQLCVVVEQSGVSFVVFWQQLFEQLIVQCLYDSVVCDLVQIIDSEINNLFSSFSYKVGEVYFVYIQIIIFVGVFLVDIQVVQVKVSEVIKVIQGGMDFNVVVICYFDVQDVFDGGDFGWCCIDEVLLVFIDIIVVMKFGDVILVLCGLIGFIIFKFVGQCQFECQMIIEYYVCQILISFSELMMVDQVWQKVQELYDCIVNKYEDFVKLVKENFKDDIIVNVGGDMGWFVQQVWGGMIVQQLVVLKLNQVFQLFQSEVGWYIL